MLQHFRGIRLLIFVLVFAAIVTACGSDDETPTQQQPSTPTASSPVATARPTAAPVATSTPTGPLGTLNIAMDSLGTENWIQRFNSGGLEDPVIAMFSDPLLGANNKQRTLSPRLATSWSVQREGTTWVWTFTLRQGIPFNEGKGQLTSDDVKFTWSEIIKPDGRLTAIPLARALIDNDLNNFQIVSPNEFKLRGSNLDVTTPTQLSTIPPGSVPILPKAYFQSVGEAEFRKHPIGSGNFIFKSHQQAEKVTLEAVPNHWRQTANVKTVNILIAPEPANRVAMLKTGQVDLSPLTNQLKGSVTGSNLKIISILKQANVFVALGGIYPDQADKHCTQCPWVGIGGNALKVREALTLAIDRQAILTKLLFGEGELSAAPFMWSPGPFRYNNSAWQVPKYDPVRAKQLLAEAGYPNGFTIKSALTRVAGVPDQVDVGEAVSSYWEAIGLKVERETMEFIPTFLQRMERRTTGGYAWVLNMAFQDEPLRNARTLFTPGATLAYIHDPKIDAYVGAASSETDEAKRLELGRQLGDHIVEQRLGVPLFSINGVWGASSRLTAWDNMTGKAYLNTVDSIVLFN